MAEKLDLDALDTRTITANGAERVSIAVSELRALIARIRELEASADSLASTLSNVDKAVRETLGIDPDADDSLPELVADWMECRHASAAMGQVPELGSKIINDACWKFIDAMPHELPAAVFNNLKPAIYAAVCHVLSATPPSTSADDARDAERLDWLWQATSEGPVNLTRTSIFTVESQTVICTAGIRKLIDAAKASAVRRQKPRYPD